MPQKVPLRSLTELEQQQFQRITKASSERIDVVRRAKTLLALAQGHTFTEAGKLAGLSRQAVAQLVERFHQRGMAAVLTIAPGRGRKPTYTQQVRTHILHTMQRPPDRQVDGTATRVFENAGTDPAPRNGLAEVVCSYDPSSSLRSWLHLPAEPNVVSNRNC